MPRLFLSTVPTAKVTPIAAEPLPASLCHSPPSEWSLGLGPSHGSKPVSVLDGVPLPMDVTPSSPLCSGGTGDFLDAVALDIMALPALDSFLHCFEGQGPPSPPKPAPATRIQANVTPCQVQALQTLFTIPAAPTASTIMQHVERALEPPTYTPTSVKLPPREAPPSLNTETVAMLRDAHLVEVTAHVSPAVHSGPLADFQTPDRVAIDPIPAVSPQCPPQEATLLAGTKLGAFLTPAASPPTGLPGSASAMWVCLPPSQRRKRLPPQALLDQGEVLDTASGLNPFSSTPPPLAMATPVVPAAPSPRQPRTQPLGVQPLPVLPVLPVLSNSWQPATLDGVRLPPPARRHPVSPPPASALEEPARAAGAHLVRSFWRPFPAAATVATIPAARLPAPPVPTLPPLLTPKPAPTLVLPVLSYGELYAKLRDGPCVSTFVYDTATPCPPPPRAGVQGAGVWGVQPTEPLQQQHRDVLQEASGLLSSTLQQLVHDGALHPHTTVEYEELSALVSSLLADHGKLSQVEGPQAAIALRRLHTSLATAVLAHVLSSVLMHLVKNEAEEAGSYMAMLLENAAYCGMLGAINTALLVDLRRGLQAQLPAPDPELLDLDMTGGSWAGAPIATSGSPRKRQRSEQGAGSLCPTAVTTFDTCVRHQPSILPVGATSADRFPVLSWALEQPGRGMVLVPHPDVCVDFQIAPEFGMLCCMLSTLLPGGSHTYAWAKTLQALYHASATNSKLAVVLLLDTDYDYSLTLDDLQASLAAGVPVPTDVYFCGHEQAADLVVSLCQACGSAPHA